MARKPYIPLWARFLLIATLNLSLLGVVFGVFLRLQLRPELESFVMARARERIAAVTTTLRAELEDAEMPQWDSILDRYSKEYGFAFLLYRNTGEQLAGPRTTLPPEVNAQMPRGGPPPPAGGFIPPPPLRPQFGPAPQPFLAVTSAQPRYWVGVRMLVDRGEPDAMRTVLILASPTFFTNSFFFEITPWLGILVAGFALSALCWLPLVRNLTHSIADMERATARIAEGTFDVGLKTQRHDELGLLGSSINQMAGRLETLTEGRKRFLGDVAHELRSPLARMQVATEILERQVRPAGQHYIDGVKEEIALMSRLTNELLQFAKAEATPGPVQLEPIHVAEAVRAVLRRESQEGAEIRVDVDPALQVLANNEYFIRSLSNVLRNAVRYAADRGPIDITARPDGGVVQIAVADSGPGVPEEAVDKIFTPFYRLDDARDRRTGGTGLGLAIVRTCIEACGGDRGVPEPSAVRTGSDHEIACRLIRTPSGIL